MSIRGILLSNMEANSRSLGINVTENLPGAGASRSSTFLVYRHDTTIFCLKNLILPLSLIRVIALS